MFGPITDVYNWHSSWSSLPPPPCHPLVPWRLASSKLLHKLLALQSSVLASLCHAGAMGIRAGSLVSSGNEGRLGTMELLLSLCLTHSLLFILHWTAHPAAGPQQSLLTEVSSRLIQYAFHQNMYLTTFPPNLASLYGLFFPWCPRWEEATHLFPLLYSFPALTQIQPTDSWLNLNQKQSYLLCPMGETLCSRPHGSLNYLEISFPSPQTQHSSYCLAVNCHFWCINSLSLWISSQTILITSLDKMIPPTTREKAKEKYINPPNYNSHNNSLCIS